MVLLSLAVVVIAAASLLLAVALATWMPARPRGADRTDACTEIGLTPSAAAV